MRWASLLALLLVACGGSDDDRPRISVYDCAVSPWTTGGRRVHCEPRLTPEQLRAWDACSEAQRACEGRAADLVPEDQRGEVVWCCGLNAPTGPFDTCEREHFAEAWKEAYCGVKVTCWPDYWDCLAAIP